jgi:hypothetical protein
MLSSNSPAVVVVTKVAGALARFASSIGHFLFGQRPTFFSLSQSLALLKRVDGDILHRMVLVSLRSDAGVSRCEARLEPSSPRCSARSL